MQLLIDSTQETPASLRFIAATLCALADTYGPPIEELLEPKPSINGPSSPIVLHVHTPAAPIDPAPLATPVNDPGQMDPAAVFGRSVPAGTTADPTLPVSLPVAPPPPVTVATVPAVAGVTSAVASDVANDTQTAPMQSTVSVITAGAADKNGMAWDVKVHSESKALNADGTWRFRRNLDAAIKAAYLASITGAAPLVPAPAAPPAPAPEAPPLPRLHQPPRWHPNHPQRPCPCPMAYHWGCPTPNSRRLCQPLASGTSCPP
jgi:hypothetical protein